FFQAEDGIRDLTVNGVQTCALPICPVERMVHERQVAGRELADMREMVGALIFEQGRQQQRPRVVIETVPVVVPRDIEDRMLQQRSEERRVGKECRARRWSGYREKKE